jgi:hypothetical protein
MLAIFSSFLALVLPVFGDTRPPRLHREPLQMQEVLAPSIMPAPSLLLGIQAIYGPSDHVYNFTDNDALTEQSVRVAKLGGEQFKLRLAPQTTCAGYKIISGGCVDEKNNIKSLKDLASVPAVANAFKLEGITYYQFWMYSYATEGAWLHKDWDDSMIEAEYNETKVHAAF